MLIYEVHISETSSSGAWSTNTLPFGSAKIRQILIKANTATTTFAFSITDHKSNIVYATDTDATGTLREEVNIPIKGICTLAVSSASADEAFTGKIVIQEEP